MAWLNCIRHGRQASVCAACYAEVKVERDRLALDVGRLETLYAVACARREEERAERATED